MPHSRALFPHFIPATHSHASFPHLLHTEVFRLLDQDPFKKLAHACRYGLLKQALYLKSEPEYCVFIIRSMSCVLTGRTPTCKWWRRILRTLSSVRMRQNFKWILVKQPENLCTPHSHTSFPCLIPMPHSHAPFPHLISMPHSHASFLQLIPMPHSHAYSLTVTSDKPLELEWGLFTMQGNKLFLLPDIKCPFSALLYQFHFCRLLFSVVMAMLVSPFSADLGCKTFCTSRETTQGFPGTPAQLWKGWYVFVCMHCKLS